MIFQKIDAGEKIPRKIVQIEELSINSEKSISSSQEFRNSVLMK